MARSDPRLPSPIAALAVVGLLGVIVNAAALIAAPLLRPEIGLIDGALSQYGIGPWAAVQNAGFVALGVGSLAIAAALSLTAKSSWWLSLGTALLALAAAASIGLAVFPMNAPGPTTTFGDTHQTVGTLAIGLHLAAMLGTTIAFRANRDWANLYRPGLVLFAIALANALLTQAELLWPALPIPFGVVMRLVVVPVLLWWGVFAVRLRRKPAQGFAASPSDDGVRASHS